MNFGRAKNQFNENFHIFGNLTEKEKYNLYSGLANLAEGLQNLQAELSQINQRLQRLEQK